ncbi:MAG: DUF2784 domain-containing protein [Gammaproteobacteria bacterium]|jgi:hypothetical protein|nr:DUF2784 domain-containing protein [Gammaproteobacteria bacterium]MDP6535532.1 DUF2784 domain-containing protein [Gammaproteobacteria bacterium]MDP6733139.1 DUF2784 domain-containing protein [Gammaproteobacteria bacterium]HAJ74986.1 DUF2784 domain-containing protein [Gammaproteobacteria bacterium]|tara:strand:- start:6454 stop:6855 length:402 start_codon:yes stop_codon:yes gene_type:complete
MKVYYQPLADAVLTVHALIVVFIVFSLLVILVGGARNWIWIRNWWFRVAHLIAIGIVVLQAWLGVLCPLTTLEMWLREQAGLANYQESFIQHWIQQLLYYDLPLWVFGSAYTVFGLAVLYAWLKFPPPARRRG